MRPRASARRMGAARRSENDPMHTRSKALRRLMSATSGATVSSALASMLSDTSSQRVSSSSSIENSHSGAAKWEAEVSPVQGERVPGVGLANFRE